MKKAQAVDLKNRLRRNCSGHYGNAVFVVAHAKFQASRGRRPSCTYRNELNPRKALALALVDIKKYEASCGENISYSVSVTTEVAKMAGIEISFDFNGVAIVAKPGCKASDLEVYFHEEFKRRAQAWRESPEGKAAARKRAQEIVRKQKKVDKLMTQLPQLDFSDLWKVILWLKEYQINFNDVGTKEDSKLVLDAFVEKGYLPGVNRKEEFNGEDKENSARWLIGQALASIVEYNCIHQMFPSLAMRWREKFGIANSR